MVINTRKAWLRAQIRQRLTSSLGLDLRTRESLQVQHLLSSLKEFEQAQNVAVYCSTLQEVDTDGIIQALFQAGIPIFRLMKLGKSCFIPVWNKKEMQMTKLANNDVFKDLPLNKWGIRYLDAPGATEWIDLIIVPGLAFNLDKKRLGHGKGFALLLIRLLMTIAIMMLI